MPNKTEDRRDWLQRQLDNAAATMAALPPSLRCEIGRTYVTHTSEVVRTVDTINDKKVRCSK